ncbi:HNH endonuclease [Nesterenkonia sp. K-15-9-6]|uniref:HNH endonuclease n=1 Tax=Nesterenkonia sp. K-15-9-6 TaxID=3093918 RepID=UPI004044F3C1
MTTAAEHRQCSFDGCDRKHRARGWCDTHWQQWRAGRPMRPIRPQGNSLESKLQRRTDKTSTCWIWTGSKVSSGYGNIHHARTWHYAHRVAYELAHGPIPDGMVIDHLCWNRACVNPDHLRAVPQQLNAQNLQGATSRSSTGLRGVTWDRHRGAWAAYGKRNGRTVYIGRYATAQEADEAAKAWRAEHYPGAQERPA